VNKSELVGRVSESIDGGRSAANRAVEAVIETIQEAVSRGEKVAISGFGVFERVERAARVGRNPATGAPVQVKASAVPKFRPGAEFKGIVSGARGRVNQVAGSARKTVKAAAAAVTPAKAAKKAAAKKAVAKAAPAKKAVAAKKAAPAKKAAVKKAAPAKKAAVKKAAPAKKAVAAKKVAAKKAAPAKKAAAKKAPAKRR
jgi:DNA-binding protein HU-beta